MLLDKTNLQMVTLYPIGVWFQWSGLAYVIYSAHTESENRLKRKGPQNTCMATTDIEFP